jgi:hypothetical protein
VVLLTLNRLQLGVVGLNCLLERRRLADLVSQLGRRDPGPSPLDQHPPTLDPKSVRPRPQRAGLGLGRLGLRLSCIHSRTQRHQVDERHRAAVGHDRRS